jgi:hypothetical protein
MIPSIFSSSVPIATQQASSSSTSSSQPSQTQTSSSSSSNPQSGSSSSAVCSAPLYVTGAETMMPVTSTPWFDPTTVSPYLYPMAGTSTMDPSMPASEPQNYQAEQQYHGGQHSGYAGLQTTQSQQHSGSSANTGHTPQTTQSQQHSGSMAYTEHTPQRPGTYGRGQ